MAGTGVRYKIMPKYALEIKLVFVCYRHHRNLNLKRVHYIPRNEVSQDLMRFWSYESLFWSIL